MYCSVKSLVPIVIGGGGGLLPPLPSPPPHPLSASTSRRAVAAVAAIAGRTLMPSGYCGLAAGGFAGPPGVGGQRELEGAAAAGRALGPDPPAVVLDDPLA